LLSAGERKNPFYLSLVLLFQNVKIVSTSYGMYT